MLSAIVPQVLSRLLKSQKRKKRKKKTDPHGKAKRLRKQTKQKNNTLLGDKFHFFLNFFSSP